ncbi:hypothetical protein [Sedimenticola selenatireducens]|uniref:hypothetical protein n=1 Tax=Sedimenticola selenatireducens TaxID=191960 RepID=UPI00048AAEBF|nr:hypothetical protein [Sedimenticola selenatireducens]
MNEINKNGSPEPRINLILISTPGTANFRIKYEDRRHFPMKHPPRRYYPALEVMATAEEYEGHGEDSLPYMTTPEQRNHSFGNPGVVKADD